MENGDSMNQILNSGCWVSFDGSQSLPDPMVEIIPFNPIQPEPQNLQDPSSSSSSFSITDKLSRAIETLWSMIKDTSLLIQIWVPITIGARNFLITINQPFLYDPSSISLAYYRCFSEKYQLSADGDSMASLGLPGRVFLRKVPESKEDVRRFTEEECPRLEHARLYAVRGSIALPVFEKMTGKCLGVIEIVTTNERMITYRPVVEAVCKALEAVDLRSSEIFSEEKDENEPHNAELLRITRTICDTHHLPLGQTWISCTQESKCRLMNLHDETMHCASIVRSACYVRDPRVFDFHKACSDNHLLNGQGVVGKAFETKEPSYAIDITSSGDGYPLSHDAELCGFRGGAVVMHAQSLHGACRSYVLEFLVPLEFQDNGIVFHYEIMKDVTMMVNASQNFSFSSSKTHAKPSGSKDNDRIFEPWASAGKRRQCSGNEILLSFVEEGKICKQSVDPIFVCNQGKSTNKNQRVSGKSVDLIHPRSQKPCKTIGPPTNRTPKSNPNYGDTNQDHVTQLLTQSNPSNPQHLNQISITNPQIRKMMQSPEFLQSLTTEEILQQMATIQKILSARLIPQPNQIVVSESSNVNATSENGIWKYRG